jgi:pimeloyl-ACP methyl ester carboxylesterase
MATYVLIPGAWLGGWCWDRVAPLLRAAGHQVLTPTLTGLGDRAHASTADVNLRTHVLDVVDVIVHANVRDAILVGHSYGGTVITGAAQEIPERLQWLVFLDASAPRPGESNNDVLSPGLAERLRESARKDGSRFFVPPPPVETLGLDSETRAWVEPRLTPHPLASLEEPLSKREHAAHVRRAFLLTSLTSEWYRALYDRWRARGWYCRELEGGHYAMFTAYRSVANALLQLEGHGAV